MRSFRIVSSRFGTAFDLERRKACLGELEKELECPDVWKDEERAQTIAVRLKALKSIVEPYEKLLRDIGQHRELLEMAPEEDDVVREIADWVGRKEPEVERFELQSLFTGRHDSRNVFLTVRAGAGGTDACDFAQMLYRMYTRWLERSGFTSSLLDVLADEEAGIRYATLHVQGDHPFGRLKSEMGVHRLVRISPYNATGKRQTSFAAVDVMPEMDDVNVQIRDVDLDVTTMRAGGPGGQHVNKTESAVRIVHRPTGIVVECKSERSQHLNRSMAMKMLAAKLYRFEQAKREKELSSLVGDKGDITFGSQIRSYVMHPYTMVKDHRTGEETGNLQAVLDGDIDRFIHAYLRWKKRPL